MNKKTRKLKQNGVAAVEFTLLLPLLLLLIFTTAELGRGIYQYSHLTRMIRDAGRHLSQTVETTGYGIPPTLNDATCNGCISDTKNILIYGANTGNKALLSGITITDVSIAETPAGSGIVVITVDYDWTPIFFDKLSGFGFGDGVDFSFNLTSKYAVRAI
ncbi:pilus assembly protein [Shewanella abyssi]|uniref:TadE/TadG family type IV pilus assembly protein n=1 Tax=Shewanella abyssi TaxID=311789 RepID=UPI00200E425F|nr:TadE/TadG family type IV pilus assembly protein [Shewanella abyssi]MCL1048203.1 pilus assembly protein [Shewanella abyssi]